MHNTMSICSEVQDLRNTVQQFTLTWGLSLSSVHDSRCSNIQQMHLTRALCYYEQVGFERAARTRTPVFEAH
jgi:hypothetical protein